MKRDALPHVLAFAGGVLVLALLLNTCPRSLLAQEAVARQPRLWAIVVSVEHYEAGEIPGRPGVRNDGRKLVTWLKTTGGWPSENILEMNDEGDPQPGPLAGVAIPLRPTRDNLDWALRKWLPYHARAGDVVLFSFTGRGGRSAVAERLLPIDAKSSDPERAGWSHERAIEQAIGDIKCTEFLSWIDAPMIGTAITSRDQLLINRLSRWTGASVWLATDTNPAPGERGGHFAAALRSALGDPPRSVLATLAELDRTSATKGFTIRQRGGVPPDLFLTRDKIRLPGERQPELLVQNGHADRINAVAIRADGRSMVTAGRDSTIRVWRALETERTLLRVFPKFLNGVDALALSVDGRYVAGGSGMGQVLVWDLADPDAGPIAPPAAQPHTDSVASIAFLADDPTPNSRDTVRRRFVSIGLDGACLRWEINGASLQTDPTKPMATEAVSLAAASHPDGPPALVVGSKDGKLHIFDRVGKPIAAVPVATDDTLKVAITDDGRSAAVGDKAGHVALIDLVAAKALRDLPPLPGPIGSLQFGPGGLLAIGAADGVHLVKLDALDRVVKAPGADDEIKTLVFSPAGDWLGASNGTGQFALWKVDAQLNLTPVKLDGVEGREGVACLAFGPASAPPFLAVGTNDGTIRRWNLAAVKEYPRLVPHRGKVRRLSMTTDGRHLLQINADEIALIWDLQEGRSVLSLPGTWTGGTFLPDGRLVLTPTANDGGWIALVEPKTGKVVADGPFKRPIANDAPKFISFGIVVASRDGKRIAAATAKGETEEVHVWDLPGGAARVIAGHERPITSIDLSDDGRLLLTAAEDGKVFLWDLETPGGEKKPRATLENAQISEMNAVRWGPTGSGLIATSGRTEGGYSVVQLWKGDPAQPGSLARSRWSRQLQGQVKALAFLDSGRYLVAAGESERMRVWDLSNPTTPVDVTVSIGPGRAGERGPHHNETTNDLLAWRQGKGVGFLSGSDDTTVRFWRIDPKDAIRPTTTASLVGTITAAPELEPIDAPVKPDAGPGAPGDAAWVAFTPAGVYDGSQKGDGLVTFTLGDEIKPLNQFAERLFHPLLTNEMRQGIAPERKKFTEPPPMLIEVRDEPDPARPVTSITISLGDPNLKPEDLRLYQNDAPVRDGSGFEPSPDNPREFVTRVKLVKGDNRFYAMTGRPDDVDARSSDLTLNYSGPENPGRIHVVALGVRDYKRNALKYPVDDADAVAKFLESQGLATGRTPGQKVLLTDGDVTPKGVETAFTKVRKDVADHPEDTVVVFLAGHTDILADSGGRQRFSLLLPDFPFPEGTPAQALLRGPGAAAQVKAPPANTYLTYETIYRNLIHLDALQRVIMVDACQAEAVVDDQGVRRVQQLQAVDRESRLIRTAYLLASRRGEAAAETPVLKHGVLTYLILRGMGSTDLVEPPDGFLAFRDNPNADINRDGRVTTSELRRYVDLTMPDLNNRLPGMLRAAGNEVVARPATTPRTQAGGVSFPLVILPTAPRTAASR